MMNGNGHTNGHTNGKAPAVNGEAAAALAALMPSTDFSRADVATLVTQAQNNISVFLDDRARTLSLITVLSAVASDEKSRQRVRASEVLLKAIGSAVDQAIKLAEFGDKAWRLDDGKATDRLETYVVEIPEARSRL